MNTLIKNTLIKNTLKPLIVYVVIVFSSIFVIGHFFPYKDSQPKPSALSMGPESTLHVYECRTFTLDKTWAVSCLVYESNTKKHFVLIDTLSGAAMAPLD